jgi:hypothetical protein
MPAGLDVTQKITYLQTVRRKMRVYLARKFQKPLVFIAVVELQGNGIPHLHLLVGSYLPKAWISAAWQSLGGGWPPASSMPICTALLPISRSTSRSVRLRSSSRHPPILGLSRPGDI